MAKFFVFFLSSLLLIALSQPDWSPMLCIVSAGIGFALFWKALVMIKSKKGKFWTATLFFALIEIIQLSWCLSDRYVGKPIYVALGAVSLWLGIEFGLVSLLIPPNKKLSVLRAFVISSLWVLMEWSRLFVLSGVPWNPIGLMLTSTLPGMQLVSIGGVFFLSFWIFLTNCIAFRWMQSEFSILAFGSWLIIFIFPYIFGFAAIKLHAKGIEQAEEKIHAVVVQTALLPEEKVLLPSLYSEALHPIFQWERILTIMAPHKKRKIDLILLSEAVVPYGTDIPLFTVNDVKKVFEKVYGNHSEEFLPFHEELNTKVGNGYFAQAIANYFGADCVVGLEDIEPTAAYNAAFIFSPYSKRRLRYEKRVLVPMGEYIPFEWCKNILRKYGIEDSFTKGTMAKVFEGKKIPFGVSICYEETYGDLMRENRALGAKMLVNLTNDVWYPRSRLPMVHFLHGRLRSVEEGIPLIRSCNTGVTCAIDSLGRTLAFLPYDCSENQACPSSLYVKVPVYTYPTHYALTGDRPLIFATVAITGMAFLFSCFKKFFS
ncbi:MAG: apolipoprotein N-acyltransferase [Chlamydiia bacterium]|nr:apolipoprotein N-acyltransferase [Chlamydiia bacterium]